MNSLILNIARPIYYWAETKHNGRKLITFVFTYRKLFRRFKNHKDSLLFMLTNVNRFKIPNSNLSRGKQIKELFETIDITVDDNKFIFTLDEMKNLISNGNVIDNISIDYSRVINGSLKDYRDFYQKNINQNYVENQLDLIDAIEILIDRECNELKKHGKNCDFLENIKTKTVESLEEGLQRVLFFNQLLWQTGHGLNGFGRLDLILNDLYENENITKDEAYDLIKEFLKSAHSYFWYKSSAIMGDTGQVIILGGKKSDGTYFFNDLTFLFIKAIRELQIPDPKLLLRISDGTPRELFEESLKTINTGVGSPLLSNDDEVIPKMIDFGYDEKDAYNYVVSACWEPSAVGKGFEQNNIEEISYLKPLNNLFDKEDLNNISTFEKLIELYYQYLEIEFDELLKKLNAISWNEDPLLSLFIDNCNKKQLDVSKGGAKYNHYGITTVSLANTVNSLYNLKKLVFEDKKYSLIELNNVRKNNFENNESLRLELSNVEPCFGRDNEDILKITNDIIDFLGNLFDKSTTRLGGKFKFGLSAPAYITAGATVHASFDGRKDFEPFSTHISSDSIDSYTELMRFSSKLHYDYNKFNGNVVDLMAAPDFIKNNFSKFTDFLMLSRDIGFFQMQMNVVSSDILIKAKENPNLYQNLIVRIWGFSAYFNDLPIEYKDLLINRALKNEGKLSI